METLILVDEEDKQVGAAERGQCHKLPGKLHRAIMVVIKNKKNEILLAKREAKKLFGGIWDGTVATHVLLGETPEQAARRALNKELGIRNLELSYLGGFVYRARWQEVGEEYEFCHAFESEAENIKPNPDEISEIAWVNKKDLKNYSLTPWFLEAVKMIL